MQGILGVEYIDLEKCKVRVRGVLGQYIQHHTKHRAHDSSQVSCVIQWPKGVMARGTRSIY